MITTKEKMIEIEKSVKDFQELEKKFLKSLKDKLEDMAKTLIKKDEKFVAYGFCPYFNDGDRCDYEFFFEECDEEGEPLDDKSHPFVQLLISVPVILIDKMYPEDRKFYFTNKGIKTEFYYDHD